ncbi:uncharacterized protein LOC107269434 isoform X2 [Cephus cinctus]|uniref:Uncharacterized protein LOC107269434 isoform X2 n=1 Tax=Cephus cinctus TaxID=211228 RepID=A0AAJ7RL07_CEPCN|nr:uncharacterized protein LOC107269434 isoform X2 [Cephus cinctus]
MTRIYYRYMRIRFSFVLPNSQDALVKSYCEKTQSVWICVLIMKFLVFLLNALAIGCVAGNTWDTNGYVHETSCISSWMSHAKRVLLIALMSTAVVLYYFPEARYYARKGCYLLIDLVANSLKSALKVTESNYGRDEFKSTYFNHRYERIYPSKGNQFPEGIDVHDDTGYKYNRHRNYTIEEERLKRHDKRRHREHIVKRSSKDDKHSHRHRHRHQRHHDSERIVANDSYVARSCGTSGIYFSSRQESNTSAVCPGEVYTSYVIRSPQDLTLIDRKYEPSDVVLVNDDYRVSGNDDKKLDVSYSEDDDPTRDRDRNIMADKIEGMKTYDKSNEKGDGHTDKADVELEVINKERVGDDDSNSSNQEIQSTDFMDNWVDDQLIVFEKRNVHQQVVTVEDHESSKNVKHMDYPPTEGCYLDRIQEQNDNEDQSNGMEILTELEEQIIKLDRMVRVMKPGIQKQGFQEYDKNKYALQTIETVLKDMKRGFREFDDKLKNQRIRTKYRSFSTKDVEERSSSFKKEMNHNRDFHTVDENLSKVTKISRRQDLDIEPEKENFDNALMNAGDNNMFNDDNDEEYSNVPIIRSTSNSRYYGIY